MSSNPPSSSASAAAVATPVNVQVQKLEGIAQFELAFSPEFAQQEYNKACRRLSQRVNIHGFRRGKAPRQVLEKQLGVERIKLEALEAFLPRYFADTITENDLDVVASPELDTWEFDLQEGIKVKAHVDLRPTVTLGTLKDQEVGYVPFVMPEDAVSRELESLQDRFTTLESVVGRPVEATDVVNIDFAGSINGEPIRGGSAKSYRLDLVSSPFIDGFAPQLVGHTLREEFTIKVRFPDTYHDNNLAGKDAEFLVKINDIQKRVRPELNDAFAQKVSNEFKTLDALKQHIQGVLEQQVTRENEGRKQRAIVEKVVADAELVVSDSMINREARILMEDIQGRFKSQGASWDEFLDGQGHENVWNTLRKEAEDRIRTSLVFGAVAKQENLRVTDGEFMEQAQTLAKARNMDEKIFLRQLANNPANAQALTDSLLANKVLALLVDSNRFVEQAAPAAPAGEVVDPAPVAGVGEGKPDAVRHTQGEEFDEVSAE